MTSRRGSGRPRPVEVAAVVLVAAVAIVYLAFGLLTARQTLGCDYVAYHGAASRFLAGGPIYDPVAAWNTECRLYQDPPTGLLLALPFTAVPYEVGMWAWIAMNAAAFVAASVLLPVRPYVRVAVLLLGAISWPFIFAVRIGQVTPLLFLLFAVGWRLLDRRAIVGALLAVGTLFKLQPAVLLGWLVVRRDVRGLAAAVATGVLVVLVAAAIGLSDWPAFLRHVSKIGNGLTQPTNAAIGALAYGAGSGLPVATAVQAVNSFLVLGVVVLAGLRASREAGYIVGVVASQVVSPIVWDHYGLILLLPVAWLLERRQWWAAAVPIALSWPLFPFMPFVIYPIAFYTMLIAPLVVDRSWLPRRLARPAVGRPERDAAAAAADR